MALNLTPAARQDCITVDRNLTPPGSQVVDRLHGGLHLTVAESGGRAYIRVPLGAHRMAILMPAS